MSSVISGYEYDIFISYRQKDNEYDGWVTEFVDHLRRELHATFKEDISIYFDENAKDGLLETDIIDKTLEVKLKSLILIPIISRTYCDPKSFAWKNELVAFNKMVNKDQFGRDIKLPGGNVVSRILPVKIHDIDPEDKAQIESELGTNFRSVNFIYKSPGVNRPLKPDDSRAENQNHFYYRDQINKVANAVKEIITGLKYPVAGHRDLIGWKTEISNTSGAKKSGRSRSKTAIGIFIITCFLVGGYLLLRSLSKSSTDDIEKSIAVLPFENMSNDPEQDYFSDGIMQEVLNHLFKIGDLKIPSSTSSMRFKGSKLSVRDIARELDVTYVLEGNVSRSGDNVRIIVRMINGKDERLIWTEDYNRAMTADNLLDIQSEVAQQVAENMKVNIDPDVRKSIEAKPTDNTEAYLLFLQATQSYVGFVQFDYTKQLLEKAIALDPGFADAYATLAYYWMLQGSVYGKLNREQVLEKAEPLLKKAMQLGKKSELVHAYYATIRLWYYWDFESVEKEFQIINKLHPSNSDIRGFFSDYLLASARYKEAYLLTKKVCDNEKNFSSDWINMALVYYFYGQQEESFETVRKIEHILPDDLSGIANSIRLLVYMGKFDLAVELFEKKYADRSGSDLLSCYLGHMGIAYFKTGKVSKYETFLNELHTRSKKSPIGSPSYFTAEIYTAIGERDKAFQSLEKSYSDHEVEMYWLNVEPLFRTLHGDPQFEGLLKKIGFK
jgi:TolB-like protein